MTSRVVASKGTNESVAQQWVGMTDARVATWPETGATRTLRTVDASSGAKLGPGELLVVAVDPGDRVRLVGLGRLGLGTGTGDLPDAITWSSDAHELRVPTWSTARFVVARATKDDATITLDVARGDMMRAPPIQAGSVRFTGVYITYGDMYIFDRWKLMNEPTLVLGMDVLGTVDVLVIDYRLRELQVRLRDS